MADRAGVMAPMSPGEASPSILWMVASSGIWALASRARARWTSSSTRFCALARARTPKAPMPTAPRVAARLLRPLPRWRRSRLRI